MKSVVLTNEQVCNFALALGHLINSGISSADALTLLKEDEPDSKIKKLFTEMSEKADGGAPLSEVIRQSEVFPTYFSSLVEVGENSGRVEQTLRVLADYYGKREQMEKQRRISLLYPTVLFLVLLAVTAALLIWVLPLFNDVYRHLGSELSGVSGVLLSVGKTLRKALPLILGLCALLVAAFLIPFVRGKIFALWNRIFGDRGANRRVLSSRFVDGVSMALSSGMNYEDAVNLSCKLSSGESPAFKARCEGCLNSVINGEELSNALYNSGFISASDRRLLDAGRRSGKQEAVLEELTQHLFQDAENALERRAGVLEPIIVAVSCLLIALVLFSVMLPLIQIMNSIG